MEEDDFISLHRKAKADTEKRERKSDRLGDQLIKVQSCQAKRAVVLNRLIQLLVRCWLPNIRRTFSQNKFMVGRNEIHRSYPMLGYHFYTGLLAIIFPYKQEYHSCAVRMKTILFINTLPACIYHYGCNNQRSEALKEQQQKNEGEPTYLVKSLRSFWLGGSLCLNKQSARFKKSKKTKPTKVNLPTGSKALRYLHQMDRHFFWCGEPLCLNK